MAHPHVWVKVKTLLVVEGGALTGLKHTWIFDDSFLASQLDEHDANKDGRLSDEELAPVAVESQSTLDMFKSFTVVRAGGALVRAVKPRDVEIKYHGAVLGMSFTVSLAKPLPLKGDMLLEVYDATYFSSFAFEGVDGVAFSGDAPSGCSIKTDAAPSPQQMRDYRQMLKEIGVEVVKPFTPRSVAISCAPPTPPKDGGAFVGEATGSTSRAARARPADFK